MGEVERLMKLGYSKDEAESMVEADSRIDHGEKLFELDPELEAGAKKARRAESKTGTDRKRKENPDKREIMQTLDDALCDLVDNVQVVNPERELLFWYNDTKYKLTLACPRS